MSFGDRLRRVMGIPEALDPAEMRWIAFREAAERHDEIACLENALAFSQHQLFDDTLRAFKQMEVLFPERRAEWLRWQGQTFYIGLAWRAKTDADRAACYQRALDCYFEAAALGDRSQEFNVVELCEALATAPGVDDRLRQAAIEKYLALFPEGDGRGRVEELRG